jgi:hypothetical protein
MKLSPITEAFLNKCLELDNISKFDPIHNCPVYKNLGCSHVDGLLCNMLICDILEKYNAK